MNLWEIYDYLVNTVHPFMVRHDQCLYNALVLTMAGPQRTELPDVPEMSRQRLLQIRDSALELVKFIEEEVQTRDDEDADDEADYAEMTVGETWRRR